MNTDRVNLIDFTKKYLRILGVSDAELDSQTEKIFKTVSLVILKEKSLNEMQEKKLENLASAFSSRDEAGAKTASEDFLSEGEKEEMKNSFVSHLVAYLADLTEVMGSHLDEKSKNNLSKLIEEL